MNKEEAIEQLYRLSLDWEEDGAFTKLNQTDINAIKIIVDELDIANKKLDEIEEYTIIEKEIKKGKKGHVRITLPKEEK